MTPGAQSRYDTPAGGGHRERGGTTKGGATSWTIRVDVAERSMSTTTLSPRTTALPKVQARTAKQSSGIATTSKGRQDRAEKTGFPGRRPA
jgi:hypothetical protein